MDADFAASATTLAPLAISEPALAAPLTSIPLRSELLKSPELPQSSSPTPTLSESAEPEYVEDTISKPTQVTHTKAATGMNGGRWTEQEHQSFLAGLRLYGREWKKVASKIKTRTSAQIRSHAQKYFAKLARDDELRRQGRGASVSSLDSLTAPTMYGYFSDGGSSAAVNSGDEDADSNDLKATADQRRSLPKRIIPALPSTSSPLTAPTATEVLNSCVGVSPPVFGSFGQIRSTSSSSSKKRGFPMSPDEDPAAASYTSESPMKQRRLSKPVDLELMPSQEELIEKASPNVRRRLSSLIEAELCALQVLSCYAMLQQHNSPSFRAQPTMGMSMISTEQIPPVTSIYL